VALKNKCYNSAYGKDGNLESGTGTGTGTVTGVNWETLKPVRR